MIRIVFWAALLVATVAAALWAVAYFSGGYARFFELAAPITGPQWAVLAAATAGFYLLDYARLYTLFHLLGIRISLGTGAQLTCVTYFVSTLTPTAELNIPAMIFLLRRKGIPASKTAAVALVKTFYMTVWVCAFGFATLLLQRDVHLPQSVADHILLFVAPAAALILGFFFVMFFPERALRWTSALVPAEPSASWRASLVNGVRRCAEAVSEMGKSTARAHFLSHASCIAFLLVYVFIGAYLCSVMGLRLSADRATAVFSNSLMISYLAPVPGSIGVTEVLTNYLLDPAMTDRGMVASTLLRFLCGYALVIPGAVILFDAMREEGWQRLRKQWKAGSA